jgi:ABC-type multidrug transport system fused ATPase/permease subunit
VIKSVIACLRLIGRRARLVLLALAAGQVVLALVDMVAVLLLGLAVAVITSEVPSTLADNMFVGSLLSIFPEQDQLVWIALATSAVLLLVKTLGGFAVQRSGLHFLARRDADVSVRLKSRLLMQPFVTIFSRTSQETAYALTKGSTAATVGVLGNLMLVTSESFLVLVLLTTLLIVDFWVAFFTGILLLAVAAVLYLSVARWAHSLGFRTAGLEVRGIESVQDTLATYRESVASARQSSFLRRFAQIRKEASSAQADAQMVAQVPKYVMELTLILGGGLLIGYQALADSISDSLPVLAVFLIAAARLTPALLRMQAGVVSVRVNAGLASPTLRLAAALEEGPSESPTQHLEFASKTIAGASTFHAGMNSDILISNVSFSFPGQSRKILAGISLEIPAGSSVALVGPSGAGKSTLVDVILGVLPPDEGEVRIGGSRPRDIVAQFPGSISYVPQTVALLDRSIRQNIALGFAEDEIPEWLLDSAIEGAHLADVVDEAPSGLDELVGEHGMRLSGGQRQRLGLARALFSRPRLLVMDEATSALDSATEYAVSEALANLGASTTRLLIAHRLATVIHCDQVVYLESGRIRGVGTFEEVRSAVKEFDTQVRLLGM